MEHLTLRRPDDWHLHVRQGAMLEAVLPYTLAQTARALIMPNLVPPIATAADLTNYRQTITKLSEGKEFTPLMTFKVMPTTTPEMVRDLKQAGAVAGKLYPEGVTTNSEDGVRDIAALDRTFAAMQEAELVLCLHGEQPGVFSLDREAAFLPTVERLATQFPRLRIVLEHITTAAAVELVERLGAQVAATITVHHLRLTLDDVIGDKVQPHHFCKPIAKRPEDRTALLAAATSGNPKFFLGTDSAPHPVAAKECAEGCAGVFTAPVMLPVLAGTFEELNALNRLEAFTSEFGARFYQQPLNEGTLELIRQPWRVEPLYGGVVPFMAGKELAWQLA